MKCGETSGLLNISLRECANLFHPIVISTHDEAHPVERCVSFHSEWMERAPDKVLVREALVRRNKFPVAIVVVVHDEISLMLEALEEVAVVVEHIVSENSCALCKGIRAVAFHV